MLMVCNQLSTVTVDFAIGSKVSTFDSAQIRNLPFAFEKEESLLTVFNVRQSYCARY